MFRVSRYKNRIREHKGCVISAVAFKYYMSKTLYILRGLPGAGKSTLGAKLAPGRCYAADDYFMVDGLPGKPKAYIFDPKLLDMAHNTCKAKTMLAMTDETGGDIAVANTLTTRKEIDPYLILAEKYGYTVQVIHCEFVGSTRGNGDLVGFGSDHNVPDAAMTRMADRWEPFKL